MKTSSGSNFGDDLAPLPKGYSIYTAGWVANLDHRPVAMVWKNRAQLYRLSDGSTDAQCNSIVVNGSDVYTAGWEWNATNSLAKVWKNGSLQYTLSSGAKLKSVACCMAFYNGDQYVVGFEDSSNPMNPETIAKVWKNGQLFANLTDGSNTAQAWGLCFAQEGGTPYAYVSGFESDALYNQKAKVWKLDLGHVYGAGDYPPCLDLSGASDSAGFTISVLRQAQAYHIISASDGYLYVAGYQNNASDTPCSLLWQLGTAFTPATATLVQGSSSSPGVFTNLMSNAGVVYSTGAFLQGKIRTAGVWKGNNKSPAFALGGGYADAVTYGIGMAGTDFVECGTARPSVNGNSRACVWLNDRLLCVFGGAGDAEADALAIVKE
jgi:hypothetical protein